MDEKNGYKSQLKLSTLNLLGELPNFIALLISAITTKAVLVFVDLIDTAGNVFRNILVVLISWKLRKDLKYAYNYGIGKIEALAAMICDTVMILSLVVMMGFAIADIISPRAAEGAMLFVVCVKALNVLGDIYSYVNQLKICKKSDSLVFKASLSVALKNLIFDITSFTAIILIWVFGDHRIIWYLSPVVSLALGGYLLFTTAKRITSTVKILLDKSADEDIQMVILSALTGHYDEYTNVKSVRSRMNGSTAIIDLELEFKPEVTYKEMKKIADEFAEAITKKIDNCEVSLKISGTVTEAE